MISNQDSFQEAVKKGDEAAGSGNWEKAMDQYYLALENNPGSPSLLEKIAHIQKNQGDPGNARNSLIQAAELYEKAVDEEKAAACLTEAAGMIPNDQEVHNRLAALFEQMGKKVRAVSEYIVLAGLQQNSGNQFEAVLTIDRCLKILPDSAEARQAEISLRLGQMLPLPVLSNPNDDPPPPGLRQNQDNGYDEVINGGLDPILEGMENAFNQLISLRSGKGKSAPAEQEGSSLPELDLLTRAAPGSQEIDQNQVDLLITQAVDSHKQGNVSKTVAALEQVMEAGLDEVCIHFLIGCYYHEVQPQNALEYLKKASCRPDLALASHLLMGQIHLQQENDGDAAADNIHALSLADCSLVTSDEKDGLAQLYEIILEREKASHDREKQDSICSTIQEQVCKQGWQQSLRSLRGQLSARSSVVYPLPVAELFFETGVIPLVETLTFIREMTAEKKYDSAMEEALHLLAAAPGYLPIQVQIGEILLKEGHVQEAVEKFLIVSDLYQLKGLPQQAENLLARISQLNPMNMKIRSKLIELFLAQGKIKETIQHTMSLASLHYQLLELDQARRSYAAALHLAQKYNYDRSTTVQILYKLVDIDLQKIDIRQALNLFEQICLLEPEDINARSQLVSLHFRLNQDDQAFSETARAVSILENSANKGKAVELYHLIIAEHPEKHELRKNLADLYKRNGDIIKAVEQLDFIADTYLTSGNKTAAMGVLKGIISLNPPNVEDYQKALLQIIC